MLWGDGGWGRIGSGSDCLGLHESVIRDLQSSIGNRMLDRREVWLVGMV